MVKRYSFCATEDGKILSTKSGVEIKSYEDQEDGDWVKYEDYKKLTEVIKDLQARLTAAIEGGKKACEFVRLNERAECLNAISNEMLQEDLDNELDKAYNQAIKDAIEAIKNKGKKNG